MDTKDDQEDQYSSDSSYDSGEDDNALAMAFMMATEEDAKTFKSTPTAKTSGKMKLKRGGGLSSQTKKTLFTSCYTDASANNDDDDQKDEDNGGAMTFGVVTTKETKQSAAAPGGGGRKSLSSHTSFLQTDGEEAADWRQAAKDRAEQTFKDKGGHKKKHEGGSVIQKRNSLSGNETTANNEDNGGAMTFGVVATKETKQSAGNDGGSDFDAFMNGKGGVVGWGGGGGGVVEWQRRGR